MAMVAGGGKVIAKDTATQSSQDCSTPAENPETITGKLSNFDLLFKFVWISVCFYTC